MNLGTPATTAVVNNGQAFYYISSTQSQTSFFLPSEKDRQVVAVYFSPGGTVDRVANYGMAGYIALAGMQLGPDDPFIGMAASI